MSSPCRTPSRSVRGAVVTAVLTLAALTGCAADSRTEADPAPSVTVADNAGYNAADLHFAQAMPPHHDQAIEMSKILLDRPGVSPEIVAIAQRIRTVHQPQLDTMYTWTWAQDRPAHTDDEDDGGAHHNGQDGLLSEYQMMELDRADRDTIQTLFLDGMVRHHQGALALAQAETRDGRNRDALALAAAIVTNHQAEIATLVDLRATI